jgi:hypothetical protein
MGNPIENTYHNLNTKQDRRRIDKIRSESIEKDYQINIEHEVYFVVDLSLGDGDVFYSHTTEACKYDHLYKQTIRFPVKIKDLPAQTSIGVSMYDFNKFEDGGLVGATVFNVFDTKRRLRQGVHDLVIHESKKPDLSYDFTTPGLPDNDEEAKEINILLSKIRKVEPKDKQTPKAIKTRLHQLYLNSKHAYIEVSLPYFDCPVVYNEGHYESVRKEIIFPTYLDELYKSSFYQKDCRVLTEPKEENK